MVSNFWASAIKRGVGPLSMALLGGVAFGIRGLKFGVQGRHCLNWGGGGGVVPRLEAAETVCTQRSVRMPRESIKSCRHLTLY